MTEEESRPSPDELLKEAKEEKRGKLKIFLGAAPGVGKTYAMLGAAKIRRAEGVDAVIGIVETHHRGETELLAAGIESLPRQNLTYRGLTFEELDLEAVLKRKPALVLIDELAHTNVPGARHPKRYMDVQEILDAGIDAYTTLNVQHIESLNDIVERITGVKVRETVPDTIVQSADSIELIDLPPDELLQRLKEGKVYIPEQARLAVHRFFTPGNLTALRELALRQAAERVDEQMAHYMRRHAIAGPWPASNRIMVCVSGDRQAASLVRAARRMAERRQTPWLVLFVETGRHARLPDKTRQDIDKAMELGESMGAETMTVASEDAAAEIIRIARERNVGTIILGKTLRSPLSLTLRPSVAAQVQKNAEGFDILLVNRQESPHADSKRAKFRPASDIRSWELPPAVLAKTAFIAGIAVLVALALRPFAGTDSLPFLFLIAVLLAALEGNLAASLLATLACGAAQYVLAGGVKDPSAAILPALSFAAAGIAISLIGERINRQSRAAKRNAQRIQSLYDFTKSIAAAGTIDDVAQAAARRVAAALEAKAAVLVSRHERLALIASIPSGHSLDNVSLAAMDWAWRHHKPAGFKSDTLPGAAFYGLPLLSGAECLGVLAIQREDGQAITSAQDHFLASLCAQTASAIERAKLVTDVAQARLQTETERLHTSLLSSISRDLREPLDNIISTAAGLRQDWQSFSPEKRFALVSHIGEESDRLDRFVENMLDMTELVTGSVRYNRAPCDLRDILQKAMHRLSRQLEGRAVAFDCPKDIPPVCVDADIMRRVFINVIENACAYSAPVEPIKITARRDGGAIKITVTDKGIGIPENERARVFDMFYCIRKESAETGQDKTGVGLGLSICRGFLAAHQGHISAHAGEGGIGTTIAIWLPISRG